MEKQNRRRPTGFAGILWGMVAISWIVNPVGILSAQTLGREVLSAGGSVGQRTLGTGGTPCLVTWTMGEPLNETYAGSKKILSQGFLQGEGFIRDTIGMDTAWSQLGLEAIRFVEVLCYPNPTRGPLQVSLNPTGACEVVAEAELTDMNGRRLYRCAAGRLPWRETLDLSAYPAGTYVLCLRFTLSGDAAARRSEAMRVRTYKIIKN